ncbi:MAG: hypothetical protein RDV48_09660 [Candidatus Eremiobacteraeota bacterium]|nr:hypothetical protein [Candidatus Eremiobacteraeota bacterium]
MKYLITLIMALLSSLFLNADHRSAHLSAAEVPAPPALEEEFFFTNPSSGAKLWGKVYYPREVNGGKKCPGLVFVPGGKGFGSQLQRGGPRGGPMDFVREGFIVMIFDPDGRGRSGGEENLGGFVHQDGLHALLLKLAASPYVDKSNIGVFTSSLGIAIGAGAVGRYPGSPSVRYLIDDEGPCDRFYITKFDDPRFVGMLGHTTSDGDWWNEREAYRYIASFPGMYLRIQKVRDHVHGENKGHALKMIEYATAKKYGGKGKCCWTRMNGKENRPDTLFTEKNPPRWLSNEEGRAAGLRFVKELRGK